MHRAVGRRRFLALSAGVPAGLAALLHGCGGEASGPLTPTLATPAPAPTATPLRAPIVVPRVNGGINVQPVRRLDEVNDERDTLIVPELVALQVQAVYDLGFDGMRITASFGHRASFLGAIPYVRAARALGIDAVVVLADFAGFAVAQALHDDRRRAAVLRLYETVFATPPLPVAPGLSGQGPGGVGRVAFQILNEPAYFLGIPPDVYVREFLAPCYEDLKRDAPEIIVVAAAEVGNIDGPPRIRAMLEAGLEDLSDRVAYHIYSRKVIPLLADNVRSLAWVTESGSAGTAGHLGWVRDTFPEIRRAIPDVTRIFYYQLFDRNPGVHRLLNLEPSGPGWKAVVESTDLHAFLNTQVATAAGGRPLLELGALLPDIRAYYPTAADLAAYDEAAEV